ncbi:MAG: sulfotransferase [Flavobacteriales bacterium]
MSASPIFILGCHRSGTSLLRSLLDGHPDLNVVPIESHYFEHSGHRIAYPLRFQEKDGSRGPSGFLRSAELEFSLHQDPFNYRKDTDLRKGFDHERFRERMEEGGREDDGPDRMIRFFQALFEAAGGELRKEGRWVEKSVEHFEFLPLLKHWFPHARFLHVVRDPYANLVSLRNFRSRNGNFPFLPPLIDTLRWHRYHLFRAEEWVEGHLRLHYEELVQAPERTMSWVAEQLGLTFYPSLLTPSYLGTEWKGNRVSGEPLEGLSRERIDAWRDEISPVEIRLLNRGLGRMIEDSGYERTPSPKGFWKKQKGELFKTYLSNRYYKNYL